MKLLARLYSTNTYSQFQVSGCSEYDKLLVLIGEVWKNGNNESQMLSQCYLSNYTEIGHGGCYEGNDSSSHIFRIYEIPVTDDTMTFNGHYISHYQVFGLSKKETVEVLDSSLSDGTAVTELRLSSYSNNSYCLFASTSWQSGGSIEETRPYLYINNGETCFSGYYVNAQNASSYVLTDIVSLSTYSFTGRWFGYILLGINTPDETGDVKAIGDWFRSTRYLKSIIDNFFVQNNLYTPYNLTIYGEEDSTISLTGQTSGLSYSFQLPNGQDTKLLFFTANETITVTDGTTTITKTLSAQNDTIRLVPGISAITRVDQYTEVGNHSYTIAEDGTYLLILSSGAGYDPSTVSYTLPNGRSEIVSDVVTQADGTYGYQMRYVIVDLEENDVLQTNISRGTGQYAWPSMINALYKIDGYIVNPGMTSHLNKVSDGNATYTPPNNNDKYLEIGIAYSGYDVKRNDTSLVGKDPEIIVEESVGYQSLIAMYYGEGSKLPTISMYGYNGGGGVVGCLRIAVAHSKYSETVLWDYVEDNNNNICYGYRTYDLTLHDNVENYEELIFEIQPYAGDINTQWDGSVFARIPVKLLQTAHYPNVISIGTGQGIWKLRCAKFQISGNHLMKLDDTYGNYGNSMGAVKVIGVNMAYNETLLWDYSTDGSGNIVYDGTALTLRQAIENFDSIIVEMVSYYTDVSSGDWNATAFVEESVNAIANARVANKFSFTSYSDRSSIFQASGTSFQKTTIGTANTNGIVKIWGVKH